jgi:chromosomal replication initiation ATPase DnaA
LENRIGKVYGGIILGGERFIKEILNRVKDDRLTSEEISDRKALRATAGSGEIVTAVCDHFGISREEMTGKKWSEARNAGVYLMKKYSGPSNKEIGGLLGGMSYSAVTKAFRRFKKELEDKRELQNKIKGLEERLSTFKA